MQTVAGIVFVCALKQKLLSALGHRRKKWVAVKTQGFHCSLEIKQSGIIVAMKTLAFSSRSSVRHLSSYEKASLNTAGDLIYSQLQQHYYLCKAHCGILNN